MTLVQGHSDLTFLNVFSLEIASLIETWFHVEHPWDGRKNVYSNGPFHMTNMATVPMCGKNHKNLQKADDLESWYAASGTQVLPNYSEDDPWLTLTYFTAMSNLVPYSFVREKGKTMDFSETIVVYDIKVGRWVHAPLWISKGKVIHWPWSKVSQIEHFQTSFS